MFARTRAGDRLVALPLDRVDEGDLRLVGLVVVGMVQRTAVEDDDVARVV